MDQLVEGQLVAVTCYGGEILTRRVVRDAKHTVIVCVESELESAKLEGRPANGIGFPRSAVHLHTESK